MPPHAPCRLQRVQRTFVAEVPAFASTRSVQIATPAKTSSIVTSLFASTRSVQIATSPMRTGCGGGQSLPPHAPCRLQRAQLVRADGHLTLCLHTLRADCNFSHQSVCSLQFFASTRSVQIATAEMHRIAIYTFFERVLSW